MPRNDSAAPATAATTPDVYAGYDAHIAFAALSSSPKSVVSGAATTLSGTLDIIQTRGSVAPEPVKGADVGLYSVPSPGIQKLVEMLKTNSKGAFSAHVKPDTNSTYVASYAGSAASRGNQGSSSQALTVDVAQKVLAHAKDSSLTKTETLIVKGSVTPASSGHTIDLDYITSGHVHLPQAEPPWPDVRQRHKRGRGGT